MNSDDQHDLVTGFGQNGLAERDAKRPGGFQRLRAKHNRAFPAKAQATVWGQSLDNQAQTAVFQTRMGTNRGLAGALKRGKRPPLRSDRDEGGMMTERVQPRRGLIGSPGLNSQRALSRRRRRHGRVDQTAGQMGQTKAV